MKLWLCMIFGALLVLNVSAADQDKNDESASHEAGDHHHSAHADDPNHPHHNGSYFLAPAQARFLPIGLMVKLGGYASKVPKDFVPTAKKIYGSLQVEVIPEFEKLLRNLPAPFIEQLKDVFKQSFAILQKLPSDLMPNVMKLNRLALEGASNIYLNRS